MGQVHTQAHVRKITMTLRRELMTTVLSRSNKLQLVYISSLKTSMSAFFDSRFSDMNRPNCRTLDWPLARYRTLAAPKQGLCRILIVSSPSPALCNNGYQTHVMVTTHMHVTNCPRLFHQSVRYCWSKIELHHFVARAIQSRLRHAIKFCFICVFYWVL